MGKCHVMLKIYWWLCACVEVDSKFAVSEPHICSIMIIIIIQFLSKLQTGRYYFYSTFTMHVYTRGTLATLKSLVKMSDLKIILASIIIYRQLQEYCWTARGHTKDRGNYNRLLAGFSSYRSVASSIGKLRSECNSKALNLIGNHPPNDIMWLYMYVCILYWSMLWSVLIWSSSAAGAWPMMYSCRRCSYIQVAQTSCPEQARHRGCNWTSLSVTNRAKVCHQDCIILHDLCSNTWRGVATVHCCVPSAIIMFAWY